MGKSNAITIPNKHLLLGLGILTILEQCLPKLDGCILLQWVDFWERIWVAANLLVAGNMSQKEIVGLL